ncbi:alpha/beta hydrolase [Nocardia terpenica]|uniref:alpha/beta hydrolase n=1 Tax=Nocardia terpenica TaxID=455432 RepID=UPI001894CD30|nr:alpha/beta hydrolase [Nocardia terpenica]MBF6059810.1 alpha/beta hydrolase [Nocardia terpenica]MBF6102649.1 alpha/beta hydrolase [Nocardia terpenica]MBF6111160.1 alpha/beta hydrolase [Nocardia terpenica]MBF6117291.1 alpha/beta hydrolase [Nocardia terpenica]MBF6150868.1 alpha/beta hydrolase [Nocardia terpenica]
MNTIRSATKPIVTDTPGADGRDRWPRSRWSRRSLAGLACVWALVVVFAVAVVVSPIVPTDRAWTVSLLVTSFSLYLVIPAIIGAVLALLMRRMRWRRAAAGVALLSVLALAGAVVPWVDAAEVAAANQVPLSLSAYFDSGPALRPPTATEVYATVDGQPLRLDVREPDKPAPGAPALVFVHGGSWTGGGRNQAPGQIQWFVDRGYTVFDIEYRLSPPPRWDQQTSDVKCAIGWVAQHADRYRIDPNDITVAGVSAGANLSLLAAYTVGTGKFAPSCPVAEHAVRAVISFYGPTDTARLMADSGSPAVAGPTESRVFGGAPATAPGAYLATSPLTYVRPGLPPTLQLQGTTDHVVPHNQATMLDERLTAAGVPHHTVLLPFTEHGYNVVYGSWPSQISYGVLDQFLTTWTRENNCCTRSLR